MNAKTVVTKYLLTESVFGKEIYRLEKSFIGVFQDIFASILHKCVFLRKHDILTSVDPPMIISSGNDKLVSEKKNRVEYRSMKIKKKSNKYPKDILAFLGYSYVVFWEFLLGWTDIFALAYFMVLN